MKECYISLYILDNNTNIFSEQNGTIRNNNSIEDDASTNYSIVACVYVAAVTFYWNRCLATFYGIHSHTE
jgi:hypothetical protein